MRRDLTKLLLTTVLKLRHPVNDIGKKVFELAGERKRFVVFEISTPFDVNSPDWDKQLMQIREKYANALGISPKITWVHVI